MWFKKVWLRLKHLFTGHDYSITILCDYDADGIHTDEPSFEKVRKECPCGKMLEEDFESWMGSQIKIKEE